MEKLDTMEKPAKIFLCSTREDLLEERRMVLEGILRLHLQHNSMEYFGARDNPPIETCLDEVKNSDILVIVVGHKYGTFVPDLDISYSEAEYNEGYRLNRPCKVYFKSDDTPILPKQMERDSDKVAHLDRWKKVLSERHTPYYFQDPTDLALQVLVDLSNRLGKEKIPRHVFFFDSKPQNTFFTRYHNEDDTRSGNIGLAFYDINIVNVSDQTYTIKDLTLKYELDGTTYSTESTVLRTGHVIGGNKRIKAIRLQKILGYDVHNVHLLNWINIKTKIGERRAITPGSVLHGSAFFVLELRDFEEVKHLENMEILIRDYSGNSSVQRVEMQAGWLEIGKDSVVQSKPFTKISD